MSATMGCYRTRPAPKAWLRGVCASLAERASVPVWLPRLAFLIFGVMHNVLALILYAGLAYLLWTPRRLRHATEEPYARHSRDRHGPFFATVDQQFSNLDDRISWLEASVVHREADLRRAFREMERRR